MLAFALASGGTGCSRATHATGGNSTASSDPPGSYMGRTLATPMSYQGADWLDRPDREATEQPEHVLDVLGVKEGMNVADVTLAQVRTSLRPRGRIALVEYRAEDPDVPIKPEHKTTLVQVRRELEANGFVFVASDESLPQQRIVVFTPGP